LGRIPAALRLTLHNPEFGIIVTPRLTARADCGIIGALFVSVNPASK
jgi:hypothetical protein